MRWHHAGIKTRCLSRSEAFYRTMFGFRTVQRLQMPGESLIFMRNQGIIIELVECTASYARESSALHFAWEVEDLNREMKILEKKGLPRLEGPFAVENGWKIAFYEGPEGEVIELVEITNRNDEGSGI